MKRVLVVGEINVDLILQGANALPTPGKEVVVDDVVLTLGSASAICAMGLARLGTSVAFLGRVGTDPWGDFCVDVMRAAGLTTSLDPGYDPSERWDADVVAILGETDLFFPNEVELFAISREKEVAAALARLDNGRTRIVAKLGADGCMTLEDGRPLAVPAFPVQPVDTTGAGDSFDAGFLYAWLGGLPIRECLRWGAACGSLSTRALGGTGHQADRGEVERLVASAP
jgi:sugar/nucleoside kinase (ribokinase family)